MEYMILIFDQHVGAELTEAERELVHTGHGALMAELDASGVKWSGRELAGPATATALTSTDGTDRVISDGPYAETKEHLGGWYVIDVPDLDQALAYAKKVPLLTGATVEVRPVVVH